MIRKTTEPRAQWREQIESEGLVYHSVEGEPYWDESVYYEFTPQQIDDLEAATETLHGLCLAAAEHVIEKGRFDDLKIPPALVPLITKSWDCEHPSIYGRFDLRYDGKSPPKLLEYNADTPTSLLEAAVVQWTWLEQKFPKADQFNSIHDRLIAKWVELGEYLRHGPVHFASLPNPEDLMNLTYLQDTATQAALHTVPIEMSEIGWHQEKKVFVDQDERRILNLFKLYPWEWLMRERFAKELVESFGEMFWIEPPWKLLLSCKGILPILWELNPGHELLLPAFFEDQKIWAASEAGKCVRKPLYSREGANVSILDHSVNIQSTGGEYGGEGYVYQSYAPLPCFDRKYPVIGSWMIGQRASGIGIRESDTLITTNLSRFVPHIIAS